MATQWLLLVQLAREDLTKLNRLEDFFLYLLKIKEASPTGSVAPLSPGVLLNGPGRLPNPAL